MRLRNTVLVLLIAAGSLAACDDGRPQAVAKSEKPCPHASELASLSASAILADKPADARLVESYADCTVEEPPYAGRFYETSMNPADVAAFYRETASREGWTTYRLDPSPNPARPADGDDFLCAGRSGSAAPPYLELWWPDNDSDLLDGRPEGTVYALELNTVPRHAESCRVPAP